MAGSTEGYSGADLELLCREAAMKPVRRLMERIQSADNINSAQQSSSSAARSNNKQQSKSRYSMQVNEVGSNIDQLLRCDPVTTQDLQEALATTKPASDQALQTKYEEWQKEFGSV